MPQTSHDTPDQDTIHDPISAAETVLTDTAAALRAGRIPRARRPLQQIIDAAIEAKNSHRAILALRLLATLELRRDQCHRAVTAANSALDLARKVGSPEDLEQALNLAALATGTSGDFVGAARQTDEWLQLAWARGDRLSVIHALLRRSVNLWSQDLRSEALESVEEASTVASKLDVEAVSNLVDRVLSGMLLRLECTAAAHRVATAALKRHPVGSKGELYEERGWMELRMDDPAAAGRDFRRARKEYRSDPDRRVATRVSSYAAAADALKYREIDPARTEQARGAIQRLKLSAARFTDIGLAAAHAAAEAASVPVPSREPATEVARRLGALGRSTSSLLLLQACKRELARLSRLDPSTATTPSSPLPPLPPLGLG